MILSKWQVMSVLIYIMRSLKQGWHFACLDCLPVALCLWYQPYVNKEALVFCSALPQNVFRIRNLILPRALLALDQSAHLQISEQINAAVLQPSAFFTFCNLQGTSLLCSRHVTGRAGGTSEADAKTWAHLQVLTSVHGIAERVSPSGVIYVISNPFWRVGEKPQRYSHLYTKASQLMGQKRTKDSLCVGHEWQNESWPSVGLWSVMRNKGTVGPNLSLPVKKI